MLPADHHVLRFGAHQLDLRRQQLFTGSVTVPLQRKAQALVQQLLASGERWCDAKLLALLAETRHAQGDPAGAWQALAQAEAVLEGMPVHADDLARVRQCLMVPAAMA